MFKSGFVTIVGRPNVGKSTLLNKLMGEKVAIVSDKPQTTRTNFNAIYNDEDSQIIFVDTPGMHKPKHRLGEFMVNKAVDATQEVDLIVFMTEAKKPGPGDEYIIEMLKDRKTPKILVLNKMDEVKPEVMAEALMTYQALAEFDEIIPISARRGKNVPLLLELLKKYLPEGPAYYPKDMLADVQERFLVEEIVREKALHLLQEEVPHGIAVSVTSMTHRPDGSLDIAVDIATEKESHKPIIIGKGGQTLMRIGSNARQELERFFETTVHLKTFVKVRKDWRDNPNYLQDFGYRKGR